MSENLPPIRDDTSLSTPSHTRIRLKKAGVFALVVVLLITLAYALRAPILTGLANYLVSVDQPLTRADLIFVLNGEYETRPFYASNLFKQGLAPRVVIAQTESSPAEELGLVDNPTQIAIQIMKMEGVPAANLVLLNQNAPVTSTFDEARAVREYMLENDLHSVILITSAFHTRRARWILEREFSGLPIKLQVSAAEHVGFNASNWWKSENGLIYLNNEYIKLFFYWIKYR